MAFSYTGNGKRIPVQHERVISNLRFSIQLHSSGKIALKLQRERRSQKQKSLTFRPIQIDRDTKTKQSNFTPARRREKKVILVSLNLMKCGFLLASTASIGFIQIDSLFNRNQ